jgi:hypothetical protein
MAYEQHEDALCFNSKSLTAHCPNNSDLDEDSRVLFIRFEKLKISSLFNALSEMSEFATPPLSPLGENHLAEE